MSEIEIFDRQRRRIVRDRAASRFAAHDFLRVRIVDELIGRLDGVRRDFAHALDLGCMDGAAAVALRARGMRVTAADAGFGFARGAGGVQCDEDRLPFGDASFDLVIAAGGLESVNDLPGALALIRRVLRPDGLFLGAMIGAGSLAALRHATLAADVEAGGAAAPRIHPQVDARAAGDLLGRAGFALPVVDVDRVALRYADPLRLIADLRGTAATNLLAAPPLGRMRAAAMLAALGAPVTETIELLYLTGWSPGPDQPKPARRGSATHSLAAALGNPGGGGG